MNHSTPICRISGGWILAAGLLAGLPSQTAHAQRPPFGPRPAAAPAVPAAHIQVYQIVGAAPKGVAGKLKDLYTGRADVQISDSITGQVIVQAAPSVQQEIGRWLASEGLIAQPQHNAQPQNLVQAASPQKPAFSEPQRMHTQSWQLRHVTARDFETKLVKTWGPRLQSSHDSVGDVATFRFPANSGGTSIVVDRRTNTATVASPASSASSWQRLLTILDSTPPKAGEQTQIIPLVKADPVAIRKAVTLLTQVFSAADTRRKQHIGQFVSMLFQQPEAGGAQPPPMPAAPGAPGDTAQAIPTGAASAASMEAIARINNVQIEILDDVI